MLSREDLDRPGGEYGHNFFYEDPNLKYLIDLENKGDARFFFTGVALNLLNLRPEICTLLLITNDEWIKNQSRGSKVGDDQLDVIKINWEFKFGDSLQEAKFDKIAALDLTESLLMPDGVFYPENFVPPGAAAL